MKRLIFTLSLLLVALHLLAQDVLSLDSCVQMALRSNREMQSATLQVQQYQHTQKSYLANFFPKFTGRVLDAQTFQGQQEINVDLHKFVSPELSQLVGQYVPAIQQALSQVMSAETMAALSTLSPNIGIGYKIGNIFHAGISLEQPIYMGGKITAAYKMSKLGNQMAQVNQRLTQDQVIVATHEAYALLVQATEMHKVTLQYDSLLSQLMTDVKNAERHGMRGHNDVLKVEVKKTEAELQVRQAENGIRLAQMNLCRYIGLPLTAEPQVQAISISVAPADLNATVANRPEYNILELKSELSAQQVKLTRSDFLPQLGVMGYFGYTHGLQVMDEYLLKKPSGSVIVSLTVPIYHANEGYHKVKAAKLEHERTMLEREDLVEKMNLELQQTINQLDESLLEVELTERSLASAAENLRSSRKSFDVGLESLSDLLEAQTLWQQAYAKHVIAQTQVLVNSAKYKKASGTL